MDGIGVGDAFGDSKESLWILAVGAVVMLTDWQAENTRIRSRLNSIITRFLKGIFPPCINLLLTIYTR
jgi:hypothetical protein